MADGIAPGPSVPTSLADFGIEGPVFMRMLRKPPPVTGSQLGDPDHLAQVAAAAFLSDRKNAKRYSLYRISTLDEFRWAATGLLSGRDSSRGDKRFTETITFLWMTAAELEGAGAPMTQTPGDTACPAANAIHFEWPAEESHVQHVCGVLIRAGLNERVVELRKPILKGWLETTRASGCRGVKADGECTAPPCRSARA